MPSVEIGTIIYGTMVIAELLKAFIETLETLDNEQNKHADLLKECKEVDKFIRENPDNVQEMMHAEILLDSLFNVLNEYAPDGCYFGAHIGDGADYGFWTVEEENTENNDS